MRSPVIVIERLAVAVCGGVLESFACTVKLEVPEPVGVPEIAPPLLIVRPLGSEPFVVEKVYGEMPPAAPTPPAR